MGCALSRVRKKVSAGGQSEHPSEVKSSTRMGLGVAEAPTFCSLLKITSAQDKSSILLQSFGMRIVIRILGKGYTKTLISVSSDKKDCSNANSNSCSSPHNRCKF